MPPPRLVGRSLRVRGVVQGVGFRPFVYRTARELGLRGRVFNDGDGAVIEAEGDPSALDALARLVVNAPPPRARIERVDARDEPPRGFCGFVIVESARGHADSVRVSADLATCAACVTELFDPADRRFRYPFVNCTDCGPRYSIVSDVPYDRARTTMSAFPMCAACAAEYDDPASRRFHAQPNACPECGPRIEMEGLAGESALDAAVAALRRGEIVALKGLGGFHLACDAAVSAVVRRLRERKHRSEKPLAVMFRDLDALEREAAVDEDARASLLGATRPIVLLERRSGTRLAPEVSPGLAEIGAFLPYTPLHHLLLRGVGGPLVMTSGNLSEEPIASTNEDARERLAGIADRILVHDRAIHMRADDSVVRVLLGRERVLRRARGHVPEAIELGFSAPSVLAVGADLKSTFCLTKGSAAIVSQHLGDLESHETQAFFGEVRKNLERLFQIEPTLVAHDLHPGYHGTAMAARMGLPTLAVQHHHAHVASCLAEHGRTGPVIGVAWDGTGYGPDGTVWGGEVLLADLSGFERLARIRPVPMPGGDLAAREPWRMAVAHLLSAGLVTSRPAAKARPTVEAMIREGIRSPLTSSAGRLFDAVASLAGVRDVNTYEGQAAMELEAVSDPDADAYPFPLVPGPLVELDPGPLVSAVLADVERGLDVRTVGGRFHAALAESIVAVCRGARETRKIETVALSGGCFQSRLLTTRVTGGLAREGFEVLLHARVPPNDGGISLGQAAVAAWSLARRGKP